LQGRYREAIQMFEGAIRLDEANPLRWHNLARAYLRVPEFTSKAPEAFRRSIDLAQRQLEINSANAELRGRLSECLAHVGELEKALREVQRALETAPRSVNVLLSAVVVFELSGKGKDALQALETLLQRGPLPEEVRRFPELEHLRGDPAYQSLLRQYSQK
jgi:tetratricopeptide (TPR) repeat protein